MTHLVGRLAVDHCPLVQTEATQVCGPRGRGGQEVSDEPNGVRANREKVLEVHASCAIGIPVELPSAAFNAAFELDLRTGVPAAQLGWAMGVVGEQEVFDRVLSSVVPPAQVCGGDGVDPSVMCGLQRAPLVVRQSMRHGRQRVRRCPDRVGSVRIARYTTGEDPTYGIVEGEPAAQWIAEIQGDPLYQPVVFTGNRLLLDDVRLLAPIIPRSKVIGIGKNYVDHAIEMGSEPPVEPLMFLIPNTAVVGPGDPVVMPRQSAEVHYEGELAVVISRLCKDVPVDRVNDVIYGYTCANDVTARDLQRADGQWSRAKGFDSFCPLGPWIETDLDTGALSIVTRRDGVVVQDGSTADMIHDVARLVAHVSATFTLLPGDVILTGTPAGVGPVEPGQRVEVEIEGIGILSNPFIRRD